MRLRHLYLSLAVIGLFLTYSQLFLFMQENGMDMVLLFGELFSSSATAFFGFDLLVTAVVCLLFMFIDSRVLKMKRLWIPVLGVFLVGIAFAFPLYLYMRELHIDSLRRERAKERKKKVKA